MAVRVPSWADDRRGRACVGLFKGDTSAERVTQAKQDLLAGKSAVGIGGHITLDETG